MSDPAVATQAVESAVPDLVPARMVNEVLYCERLFYLEWAQGEFADNHFTIEGRVVHKRADHAGGKLPPKPAARGKADGDSAAVEAPRPREERPYEARSVWLSSPTLGLTAKIDIVEGTADGTVVPIEYKRGSPPDLPERAWLPERAQLCCQVLLLREHGYRCDEANIYYAEAKQRVAITIDDALIARTIAAIARARALALAGELPPPLIDSPKCNGCSLVGICLPDEVHLLKHLVAVPEPQADVPPALQPAIKIDASFTGEPQVRRLFPARDDRLPLYVTEHGARIGLDGECMAVTSRSGERTEVRLNNTSQVCLLGNVQVTTQTLRTLLEREIPLSFFSSGGWYYGRAEGNGTNNIELRIAQHRRAADPEFCVRLARGFVAAKVRNCRTLLRRNLEDADPVVLGQLEQAAKSAERAESLATLLGIEGSAARVYFGAFPGLLKPDGEDPLATRFDFQGRNRRPPRDPVNALLSFAYSMLAKDLTIAVSSAGLERLLGFYHQPRFGRPALALDLMEEFRPLVADSIVVSVINGGVITPGDFTEATGAVAIKPPARKRFIEAYERRMDVLITHPVFGYQVSYRRVLEIQARLLGRVLLGELDEYPAFRTR